MTAGIIGRERALIDGLAKLLHKAVVTRHEHTSIIESRRGSYFEVRISDPDGEPTGRVARVTVELTMDEV
jgi:hypothetical protein